MNIMMKFDNNVRIINLYKRMINNLVINTMYYFI